MLQKHLNQIKTKIAEILITLLSKSILKGQISIFNVTETIRINFLDLYISAFRNYSLTHFPRNKFDDEYSKILTLMKIDIDNNQIKNVKRLKNLYWQYS